MKHRLPIVLFGLALSLLPVIAAECPATYIREAEQALVQASSCDAAIALYEACGGKATSFVNLGVLAIRAQERCEKDFLPEIHGRTRQIYKLRENWCYKRFLGSKIFYTPRSACGPYLAQDYAHKLKKAKEELAKNPNPPV